MASSADTMGRLRLTTGDITRLKVDAIVNAANVSLSAAAGLTVPPIGPRGLRYWSNAENWADVGRESLGPPAGTVCRPCMSSRRLARSGRVGQGSNKF
jgi:hypothetical protein